MYVPHAPGRAVIREMSFVHRMTACPVCLLVCLLVFVPRFVTALELGPIETRSALYEPLDARIPVQGARSGDLKGLNVMLGSPAQFELAGVARLQHLTLLQFVVVEQGGGDGYIHVRTDEPIIEPSLTFLIDVDWPRGRTVRGYRLHLAPAAGHGADADRSGSATPQAQPAPGTGTSDVTPASSGVEYGPIRKSETLWSIAARMRPDKSVSVQRMMLAILQANPDAFEISNINALNAGTILRIPTRSEIGPDNLNAAIAEVQRQHSAWTRYRNEGRATPTPSAPTPETLPRDSAAAPAGGRLQVVSPESTTTPNQEEGTRVATLRKELALAMEEADASRRESDELELRLAEAEDHIKELNQLVELKNEEIAALRSELQQAAETAPRAVGALEETEPKPAAAPEEETKPALAPVEEKKPVLAPEEAESKPAAPETEEGKPVLAPTETERMSVPAPAEAESKPTTAAAEPKSLPFGLGSLPVNPVFLVGGAGLLLILLGVAALLRRRRASSGEDEFGMDDTLETAESSPSGDDDLLLELEAVAAELADERDDSHAPPSRAMRAAASDADEKPESVRDGPAESAPEDIVKERIAELWRDDRAVESDLEEVIRADSDSSELTFDIDALTADDSDLKLGDDDVSDEIDIGDLADLVDLAAERETEPDRPSDEPPGNLDLLLSRQEARAEDFDMPAAAPGDSTDFDPEILDEALDGAPPPAAQDHEESRSWEVDAADTSPEDADVESEATTGRSVDDVSTVDDDAGDPDQASQVRLDESTEDSESDAFSLEEFGEDEAQTKIDLAQVYMEMGDTESARGFLEAVLAEGDAQQQEAAREMLSKLG